MADNIENHYNQRPQRSGSSATGWVLGVIIAVQVGNLIVQVGATSISGAVGSLVMMTRQRSAELALDGVLGATPAQRAAIPVLEALIVTITATMLAAVMVAMMLVVPVLHFETVLGGFAVGVPWLVVVQVVGALAAVVVAATALPATPSLRQPAPKVIARLVAALRDGQLAAAGLDVFATEPVEPDNPLLALDNVVVSPHVTWYTVDTMRRYLTVAIDNCRRLAEGLPLCNVVNEVP